MNKKSSEMTDHDWLVWQKNTIREELKGMTFHERRIDSDRNQNQKGRSYRNRSKRK